MRLPLTPLAVGTTLSAFGIGALAGVLVLTSAAPATSSPATAAPVTSAEPTTWSIDAAHSSLLFKVKHMNVAWFFGRFNDFDGEIVLDEEDPSKSKVTVVVKTESVDTGNDNRDKHLRNQDFFDAGQFPELRFESTKVAEKDDAYEVTGDLTIRGTTKPVTVTMKETGEGPGSRGSTLKGFYGTFTIDRFDYGVSYGDDASLSKDVEVTLAFETVKQ